MKAYGKRLAGFGLATLLLVAGCTGKEAASSPGGQTDTSEGGQKPVSFSFYGNYDWMTTAPWAENPSTKWIQENKKVTITPIQSGGSAVEKLNTMIVSDDLPDVILTDRGADVERLANAGQLVPLDDYYNKYPNFKKYVGDSALNLLRSEDGKLYQIPNWYTGGTFGNGGWMINKKIYNELGKPALETYDDLYAYLVKVKEKYPDVVPLEVGEKAAGINLLYGGMAENRVSKYISMGGYPEGKELKSIYTDPVFKETLLFANKLFRERLITQDALTQNMDAVKQKVNTGKVAVMLESIITTYGEEGNREVTAVDPDGGYQIIWPLHKAGVDKNKVWIDGYDRLGWNVSVITKKAKDPEGIFAYYDWMTGPEGQKLLFFGPKGLYWDEENEDGTPIPNELYKTGNLEERTDTMRKFEDFNWAGNTSFIDKAKLNIELLLPENKRSWSTIAQSQVTWKTALDISEFINVDPLPDSQEGIISQRLSDIYTQAFAKMMFAKDDNELLALFDKAASEADKAGIDKLLKFRTDRWQGNLEKMKK